MIELLNQIGKKTTIKDLIILRAGKLTTAQIAELAKVPESRIVSEASTMGISLRMPTVASSLDDAIRSNAETMTCTQIARMQKVDRLVVWHRAKRIGVKVKGMKS